MLCGIRPHAIVVFDIHGEYSKALADRATVFRVSGDESKNETPLHVPYWALSFDELIALALGRLSDSQMAAIADSVVQLKGSPWHYSHGMA